MQDEGVGADVSGDHQPPAVHLLTESPDVDGQRSQVCTRWDEDIGQKDRTAEVERDKATSSFGEGERKQEPSANPIFYLKKTKMDNDSRDQNFSAALNML